MRDLGICLRQQVLLPVPHAGEAMGAAAQIEIARGLTDNESIGDIICKRADTLNALAVVRALAISAKRVANDAIASETQACMGMCSPPVCVKGVFLQRICLASQVDVARAFSQSCIHNACY